MLISAYLAIKSVQTLTVNYISSITAMLIIMHSSDSEIKYTKGKRLSHKSSFDLHIVSIINYIHNQQSVVHIQVAALAPLVLLLVCMPEARYFVVTHLNVA